MLIVNNTEKLMKTVKNILKKSHRFAAMGVLSLSYRCMNRNDPAKSKLSYVCKKEQPHFVCGSVENQIMLESEWVGFGLSDAS